MEKIDFIKIEAQCMLNELENNRLEVCLSEPIDSTGRRLRLVQNRNPEWYRRMFHERETTGRKHNLQSNTKRYLVVKALQKISEGHIWKGKPNHDWLLSEIKSRLMEGYECKEIGCYIPPNEEYMEAKNG